MRDAIEQFRSAIHNAGLHPPGVIEPDGKLHRFASNGKRSDDAGWYVLHDDGIPAGAFGDWRTGVSETWRADIGRKLTPAEDAAHRAKVEAIRREREAEEAREQAGAATKALTIWKAAPPAPEDHPYLKRKGIKPHGARVHEGRLVIPMRDTDGKLHSLQFIGPDGEKLFLPGGRVKGCYFSIGKPDGVLCIAEGYATAAIISGVRGCAVAVAFNAGNLQAVAESLRRKFPNLRLILCADDDYRTAGNPGLMKATEAARAVGGLLAVPDFGADRPEGATDFNDLAKHSGAEAMRAAIEAAQPVGEASGDPSGITYRCMADVQPKPIRWLWPGRIARGKVSLIAGHPGLGKSQAAVSFAAIVSTGGLWPVDRTRCERGAVVILSAEDDPEDTIRPRLEAAGADLSRVYVLDAVREADERGEIQARAFNLATDISRLGVLLGNLRDVALIVIDPVSAYLGGVESHNNAEVRALLAPLAELAARHGVAVIAVSHLNKASGTEALLRVQGSIAFSAAARAVWGVARDKENPARRLFLPLKNNLGHDQTGLAFTVEEFRLLCGIETSRVGWEGHPVTITAEEAFAPEGDREDRSAVEDAREFLLGLLADGPMAAKRVYAEGREAGHSERAIRRAQKALGIESEKAGMREGWQWRLPAKMAKNAEDGQEKTLAAFGNVGRLREPTNNPAQPIVPESEVI